MRVLVVEDNDEIRESLVRVFEEEGYAVDGSGSGDEGFFRGTSWDYDLVILDIMLPGRDGWDILAAIREKETVPVMLVSALGSLEDRLRGLRSGADDYVTKPFDLEELLARAEVILRRSKSVAAPSLEAGGVRLDDAGKRVFFQGKEAEVTPIEFGILKILLFNRGTVISRSYLYDHLFDEGADTTFSNMIDVYVFRLRKKFGKDLIKTRRGQGYVIEEDRS